MCRFQGVCVHAHASSLWDTMEAGTTEVVVAGLALPALSAGSDLLRAGVAVARVVVRVGAGAGSRCGVERTVCGLAAAGAVDDERDENKPATSSAGNDGNGQSRASGCRGGLHFQKG